MEEKPLENVPQVSALSEIVKETPEKGPAQGNAHAGKPIIISTSVEEETHEETIRSDTTIVIQNIQKWKRSFGFAMKVRNFGVFPNSFSFLCIHRILCNKKLSEIDKN